MTRPTGEGFGIEPGERQTPDPVDTPSGESDPFENLPTVEEPAEQPPAAEPSAEPAQPEAPASAEAEPQPEGDDGYEDPRLKDLFGGRFRTFEDLEKGYKNIQRVQSQTFEQARAQRAQLEQYQRAIEQVRPIVEQHLKQRGPSTEDILTETDPDAQRRKFEEFIDSKIEEGVAQRLTPLEQQRMAEEAAALSNLTEQFYRQHQIEQGGELDMAMAQMIQDLWQGPQGEDPTNFPVTPENLDAVYRTVKDPKVHALIDDLSLDPRDYVDLAEQVVQNPAVEKLVRAMPALLDSPNGLDWAREQAERAAPSPQEAGTADDAARQAAAFSETGGSRQPVQTAPGALDPEIERILRAGQSAEKGAAFFGG